MATHSSILGFSIIDIKPLLWYDLLVQKAARIVVVLVLVSVISISISTSASAATKQTAPSYLRYTKATYKQIQTDLKNSKTNGNMRYTFIKVGDSNTQNHYSLYGLGCYRYSPVGLRSPLEQVVYRYRQAKLPLGSPSSMIQTCNVDSQANSFSRASFAAQGGATAAFALTPNPSAAPCVDSALVCELKAVKPRYAFIQFGTNEARLAAGQRMSAAELNAFQQNLAQIIRTTRAYGTTPVLITAPVAVDNGNNVSQHNISQRIVQINKVVRSTSKTYRAPMIDLWYAQRQTISPAYNYGLKKDGIHLASSPNPDPWVGTVNLSPQNRSKYAMNLRSYIILDSLEKLDKIPTRR